VAAKNHEDEVVEANHEDQQQAEKECRQIPKGKTKKEESASIVAQLSSASTFQTKYSSLPSHQPYTLAPQ
jgi:hypothetical protein